MSEATNLMAKAEAARDKAHAPYSKFKVGAALETADGEVFAGCNVENASYSLTLCAEAAAIATMVSQKGITKIQSIAVTCGDGRPCYPCGACLQRIQEFAAEDCRVMVNDRGRVTTYDLSALYPHVFDASYLET